MKRVITFTLGFMLGALAHRFGVHHEVLRLSGIRPLGRKVVLAQPADTGLPVASWHERFGENGYLALLAAGQSQAANFGEPDAWGYDSTWVLVGKRVHRSSSPLPGVEGTGGSIWPKLAAHIERRDGRPVLIVPLAVGATRIRDWEPSQELGRRLQRLATEAGASGVRISAVLLMQGEADAALETAPTEWLRSVQAILRSLGPAGKRPPLFVARETRCFGVPVSAALRRAQSSVVDGVSVFGGPDLDELGPAFRWDGCHFTSAGLDSIAAWWAHSLAQHGVVRAREQARQ